MRFTLRILGLELIHVDAATDQAPDGPGEATSYPVGFTARWDQVDEVECE